MAQCITWWNSPVGSRIYRTALPLLLLHNWNPTEPSLIHWEGEKQNHYCIALEIAQLSKKICQILGLLWVVPINLLLKSLWPPFDPLPRSKVAKVNLFPSSNETLNIFWQPAAASPFASYFHKGLMWRGVKVEISRKNSSGYDKSIFSKVLWIKNFSIINGTKMTS